MFQDYTEKISHVFLLPLQSKKTREVQWYQTECIKEKRFIFFVKYVEQASLPLDHVLWIKRGFWETHRYITKLYLSITTWNNKSKSYICAECNIFQDAFMCII